MVKYLVRVVAVLSIIAVAGCGSGSKDKTSALTGGTASGGGAKQSILPSPNACPRYCVGRARADVDGDGKLDNIGYFTKAPIAWSDRPQQVVIRVVFATGKVVVHRDTYVGLPALIGAADANGDGRGEIFYLNELGAHTQTGHILRWNGTSLAPVTTNRGALFSIMSDGYANGVAGFRCVNDTFVTSTLHPADINNATDAQWTGTRTSYRWSGMELRQTAQRVRGALRRLAH